MTGAVEELVGDDLDALTVIRGDVAADLTAAGFIGTTYRGPHAAVGSAIVVPGRPYVSWRSTREDELTYGEVRVGFDVLLLGRDENTAEAAAQLDQRIAAAVQALDRRAERVGGDGVTEVSQPGRHTIRDSGSFLAVVITTTEHHRF